MILLISYAFGNNFINVTHKFRYICSLYLLIFSFHDKKGVNRFLENHIYKNYKWILPWIFTSDDTKYKQNEFYINFFYVVLLSDGSIICPQANTAKYHWRVAVSCFITCNITHTLFNTKFIYWNTVIRLKIFNKEKDVQFHPAWRRFRTRV